MSREHDYTGTHATPVDRSTRSATPDTYTIRQLVAYQHLIERGRRTDPDLVVRDYIRANPGVDLEARATFEEWRNGALAGDTVERRGGFLG